MYASLSLLFCPHIKNPLRSGHVAFPCRQGMTALMHAARRGRIEIMKLLIDVLPVGGKDIPDEVWWFANSSPLIYFQVLFAFLISRCCGAPPERLHGAASCGDQGRARGGAVAYGSVAQMED